MSNLQPKRQAPPHSDSNGDLWVAVQRVALDLAGQTDVVRTLESMVQGLRASLGVDRAGIFYYDRAAGNLVRLVGIDPQGELEYEPEEPIVVTPTNRGPIRQVVRGEIPFFHSHDVRADLPDFEFGPGIRAHAIVPLVASGQVIGALAVDNLITDRDIPESLIEPLKVFGQLAGVALYGALRQRELLQVEAQKKEFYREVVFAITNGKLVLCDREEIDSHWSEPVGRIEIRGEGDVREVREMVRRVGESAELGEQRLYDLSLCASEAATNALRHGEGGLAEAAFAEGRVCVRVEDRGTGMDPLALPRATLMKGFSTRSSMGLGFTIMHELADKIYLYTGAGGTTLILEMSVVPPTVPEMPVALLNWDD